LDHRADAVGIVSLVRQHDGMQTEMVDQRVQDLAVVRLPRSQAKPDREALRVDDDVAIVTNQLSPPPKLRPRSSPMPRRRILLLCEYDGCR
jgi:hypothetical protein